MSFGALSRPDRFSLPATWDLVEDHGGQTLLLAWSEEIGRPAQGPPDGAAGQSASAAWRWSASYQPRSTAPAPSLTISDGRLDYRLTIPPGQFELD